MIHLQSMFLQSPGNRLLFAMQSPGNRLLFESVTFFSLKNITQQKQVMIISIV